MMGLLLQIIQVLLLLGCGTQASQFILSSESSTEGATLSNKVTLSEAAIFIPRPGNVEYTLPTKRTFLLNIPESYRHGEALPLVFSFHGAGGFSEKQQRVTELSNPSLRIGGKPFLTVYPQGVNNTDWKMTHIWKGAPYENKTVDDASILCKAYFQHMILTALLKIAYVFDMVAAVTSAYSVDVSRIYACGKSNGGGFTALLACRPDTSALFAAFAPVSPALYQGTYAFFNCSPSDPKPILHAHGVEDTITPFGGRADPNDGPFGPEPDVRLWRRRWTERNGCKSRYDGEWPQPKVEEVHPGAWEEVWDCPGAEVRALTIEGLGHAWPSTLGLDLSGRPNQTANFNFTSQHLVQFFSRHKLKATRSLHLQSTDLEKLEL